MKNSKSRSNHLMHFFEMENDYLKHRKKIINIQKRDAFKEVKKNYTSQMAMINSFQKNYNAGEAFKSNQRQRTITHENQLLHNSLMRQYKRPNPVQSMNSTFRSSKSSCSMKSSNSKKKIVVIKKQNERMMEKMLTI